MQRHVLSVRTTIQELWVPLSRSFPSPVLWDFMNFHYIIGNSVCYWGSAQPSAPVLPVEVRGGTGSPKLLIMLWSFWWKVFPCKKLPRIPSYYQVAPLHVKASLITEFLGFEERVARIKSRLGNGSMGKVFDIQAQGPMFKSPAPL